MCYELHMVLEVARYDSINLSNLQVIYPIIDSGKLGISTKGPYNDYHINLDLELTDSYFETYFLKDSGVFKTLKEARQEHKRLTDLLENGKAKIVITGRNEAKLEELVEEPDNDRALAHVFD